MTDKSKEVNRSRGWPALEKFHLARWAWKDLNIFGWPLVAAALGLLLLVYPWSWAAAIPFILLLWLLSFFRDPRRQIPVEPNAIVSPADGIVTDVTSIDHDPFVGGPAVRIGIFLSIFNVHINRAPLAGRVVELLYQPGEFLNAMRPESSERNESMWIGFERTNPPAHKFTVKQISGMLARRIVCTLERGQTVARGEKFGMIKLGSRTELVLPADAVQVVAEKGSLVKAGSHIVARWK